jgi:guanosine-3',5'-bis(diphosphate) 3'-pyrophosphohydrolase
MKKFSLVFLALLGSLKAGGQTALVPQVEVAPLPPEALTVRERLSQQCNDHAETLQIYDRLESALRAGDFKEFDLVEGAVLFAASKHAGQQRKGADASPFVVHPLGVALILCVEGGVLDSHVLAAAILHDTVENTDASFDELRNHFGEKVASIVAEVSDNKSLPREERRRLQIATASSKSREAKLVKLGDNIHNLRGLEHVPPTDWERARIDAYFAWAEQVVRGLRGTCQPLEERLDALFEAHQVEFAWG